MYYIGKYSNSVDGHRDDHSPNKKPGWGLESEAPLESSFMFESEGSGFFRVRNADKKTDESVPAHECAPIAIF